MEELTLIDKRVLVEISEEYIIGPMNHLPEWPEHPVVDLLKSEEKLKRMGFIKVNDDGSLEETEKAEEYKKEHEEEFSALFKEFRRRMDIH